MTQSDKAALFASLHRPGDPADPLQCLGRGQRQGGGRSGRQGDRDRQRVGRRRARLSRRRGASARPRSRQCRAGRRGGRPAGDDRFRGRLCRRCRAARGQHEAAGGDRRDRLQFRGPGGRRRGAASDRGSGRRGSAPCGRRSAPDFFINARTDIFLKAKAETHDDAKVDAALERARAYAEAGASGFFAPGLADLELLERLCAASPLPVNFMAFPGAPDAAEVAAAGVARISHGPFPYKLAMKALKEAAEAIYRRLSTALRSAQARPRSASFQFRGPASRGRPHKPRSGGPFAR